MKHLFATCGLALVIGSTGNALAHNNGGGGGSVAPSAGHSSSSATSAPHVSGMPAPHFSGMNVYRPVVTYRSGTRTLNYPPVGNSIVRQPIHSTTSGINNGHAVQQTGNVRQTSHQNALANHPLDPQTASHLRNWNGKVSSTQQAHSNHLNNVQHHHDHDWWRHHCIAFVFFDFGWWGWWDGWWYPAWGYDPYSYYEYNEPIYGYGGESPEQIIANVQTALQQLGYYQYAVDGKMGPLTRSALARYQRDHRLPITSAIDPATLGSLAIIR